MGRRQDKLIAVSLSKLDSQNESPHPPVKRLVKPRLNLHSMRRVRYSKPAKTSTPDSSKICNGVDTKYQVSTFLSTFLLFILIPLSRFYIRNSIIRKSFVLHPEVKAYVADSKRRIRLALTNLVQNVIVSWKVCRVFHVEAFCVSVEKLSCVTSIRVEVN